MINWQKWLWGGVGWAFGGPIGAILAFSLASMSGNAKSNFHTKLNNKQTYGGDFGVSLLILLSAVMNADNKQTKSELEFIKNFLIQQFGSKYAKERLQLFKEILKQKFSLNDVCSQIKSRMDYSSRLQIIHVLFGLSNADNHIHNNEINIIQKISVLLEITQKDFISIQAMFYSDKSSYYKILEIDPNSSNNDVKKAYRKMAVKFHPDKVQHLGPDFQKLAEEKFKTLNNAYQQIKKYRGIN